MANWSQNIGQYLTVEWHKQICRVTNEISVQLYSTNAELVSPPRLLAFRLNLFVLYWLVRSIKPEAVQNIYFHSTVEHGPWQIEKYLLPFIELSEEQGEANCHPGL